MRREGRGAAHVNAALFGAFASFARAGTDQVAFELGNAAKDGEQQAPMRGRGVRPCLMKRTQTGSGLRDPVERVQEVARRSREAVKPRHQERVAFAESVDRTAQLRAVGLGSADRLGENLLESRGALSLDLSANALAVGRNAGVAENHTGRLPERRNFCNRLLHAVRP